MTQKQSLEQIFTDPRAKAYFTRLCGSEQAGQAFVQQLARVCQQDPRLQFAEPQEVFNAAVTAAELDLPLHKVFKTAYIIPAYNDKEGKWTAQFVIGYKGLRLLAQRTGEFKRIVALPVYEGQIIKIDPVKGSKFNFAYTGGDKIVGFYAYLETHNGFRDEKFWTDEQMRLHAAKYSQDYHDENSIWHTNYAGMGKKTLLKALLNESAPLYQQVQTAIAADHSVNDTPVETVLDGQAAGGFLSAVQVSYPDNPTDTSKSELAHPAEQQTQPIDAKMAVDGDLMQTILENVRQGLLTKEQVLANYALTDEQQGLLDATTNTPKSEEVPPPEVITPAVEQADDKAATPVNEQGEQRDLLGNIIQAQQGEVVATPTKQSAEQNSGGQDAAPKGKGKRKATAKKIPLKANEPEQEQEAVPVAAEQAAADAVQESRVSDVAEAAASAKADTPAALSQATTEQQEDPISTAIVGMIAKWKAENTENTEQPGDSTPAGTPKDHVWQGVGDASATGWSAVVEAQKS